MRYSNLSPDGPAARQLGPHPSGTITGAPMHSHKDAAASIATKQVGVLLPCMYDSEDPAVGFWNDNTITNRADRMQQIALFLAAAGLSAALAASLGILKGIRIARRYSRRVLVDGIQR